MKGFIGIDDANEPPEQWDITLDTVSNSLEDNARLVLNFLIQKGFVRGD